MTLKLYRLKLYIQIHFQLLFLFSFTNKELLYGLTAFNLKEFYN